jgi:[ribosomal protein S18]-alanine N-acetyltransferase
MSPHENIKITITSDPEKFPVCAGMMAATDPWITLQMDLDQCLKAFEGSYREICIAESGDEIAGFVIMQTCGTFSGYIQTICVSVKYRGIGIGTKLLEFCEKRILSYSPNIFICVSSFNTGAAKLYYSFGFTLVGQLENFVKEGFSELLLRKTVGPRVGYKTHIKTQL